MKYILLIISLIFFVACSNKTYYRGKTSHHPKSNTSVQSKPTQIEKKTAKIAPAPNTNNSYELDQLYAHYRKWKGTPYKFGGVTRSGIDCSGFVFITYEKKFAFSLPRDTLGQVKEGKWIPKKDLKTGDLIFFRTGSNTRHVGIYLEKGTFMHASSSRGVTISKLNTKYWKKRYWQSRRMY